MKTKHRITGAMAVAAALAVSGLYSAPMASATATAVDNGNGSFTVTGLAGSPVEIVYICPTSVLAANCDGTVSRWIYNYGTTIPTSMTFSSGTLVTETGQIGVNNRPLADGIYNIGIGAPTGARVATLSNVTIGAGGGSSSSSTPAPAVTLTLNVSATGTSCTDGNPSGVSGSWLTLPTATQCTQSGPTAKGGAVLLGWSTNASFPIARAQAQVDKKWGAIDETIDGTRMIFIPAGMATFVSGSNNMYPIWSK